MRYPRVTEIISPFLEFPVSNNTLELACERGKLIHKYCVAELQDLFVPEYGELEGYVQSFRSLLPVKLIKAEFEVKHEQFGYIGHPDMVVEWKGEKWLWDLKTSEVANKAWIMQLSAYYYALPNELKPDKIAAVRLRKDGKPAIVDTIFIDELHKAFQAFLNFLNGWRYLNAKK